MEMLTQKRMRAARRRQTADARGLVGLLGMVLESDSTALEKLDAFRAILNEIGD